MLRLHRAGRFLAARWLRGEAGVLVLMILGAVAITAQVPSPVDTSRIGPPVGEIVPAFSGTDQFGRRHTLESIVGSNGAMLVFFRSADW
jgi:hypothetical protein